MLRILYGTAGSGKTGQLIREISRAVDAGESALLIVPEQYSHEAERELCRVCGDRLSLYAEVLSFSRLAVRVAQEMGGCRGVSLDKAGKLLCAALAVKTAAPRLRAYRSSAGRAELVSGMDSMIQELRTAGISPRRLSEAAGEASGELGDKLYDMSLCMEAYNALLAQGRIDSADRLIRLAETVADSSAAKKKLFIDGFTDFTGAEYSVIDALADSGAEVTVCLTLDDIYGNAEHFQPSRTAARRLLSRASERGWETVTERVEPLSSREPELEFFLEHLFSYSKETMEGGGAVSVWRCDSVRAECTLAAKRCLELVRQGERWRDIAVAARGFDSCGAALEEVFEHYGIPLFTLRRDSILQMPVPALISAAFDVILGGWELSDVRTYYKTGLLDIERESLDSLDSYALRWELHPSSWLQSTPWKQHPDGFSAEMDEEAQARLDELDALRRSIAEPLIALQKRGAGAATALGQAEALSAYFTEIDLPATLEKKVSLLESMGKPRQSAEYSQIWDAVVDALEQFSALLGDTPMDQAEFSGLFLKTLSRYDVSVIPVSADSVSAGELDRMRRRHIKHLILMGASDEALPAPLPAGGLLSPDERDALDALGLSLGGGAEDYSRELSLIYNCAALPSSTLTISYSCFDAGGSQSRPSVVINRAKRLLGIEERIFDWESARLEAPRPLFLLAAENSVSPAHALAETYVLSGDEGDRLRALRARAEAGRGSLAESSVTGLYGRELRLSPSRADSFTTCRFAYFLRYGLKLREKESYAFDAPELGSFTHYVLENTAREIKNTVGFKAADEQLCGLLADKYTDLYVKEQLHGFFDKSQRFKYLFDRLRPTVRRITADMVKELSLSDFEPLDFELSFGMDGRMPPVELSENGGRLFINGIADRVDGWFHDDKLYLRVIDYKTGKKSFSLSDVWYGLGLQMLLYLFALEDGGQRLYGREIVPAGVMYVPARAGLVSSDGDMTDSEIDALRSRELRRSGLILDDPQVIEAMEHGKQTRYLPVTFDKNGERKPECVAGEGELEALRGHVERRMLELSEALRAGSIDARPCYRNESDNACLYCAFPGVCRFDEKKDGRRYMEKLRPDEFWRRLGEEK